MTNIQSERQSTQPEQQQQLAELFGNYKAEWLREKMFDLFTQPAYLPDLLDRRPCILMGGRGTGKTTALRALSYEGQFAFAEQDASKIDTWDSFGLYYRVDTNRVTAFQGPELSQEKWTKLFAHYMNLLLCGQVVKFLNWYSLLLPKGESLSPAACSRVAISLCLAGSDSVADLNEQLRIAKIRFEAFLNNLSEQTMPQLSMQSAPVEELVDSVCRLKQFRKKHFFFLIDEYENFTDQQQIVVNTLIKHAGANYTFKIGVRELGWRMRATLNANEQLNSPADYVRINIADRLDRFDDFAATICNQRLAQLHTGHAVLTIQELLPELTDEDEAMMLGVNEAITASLERLKQEPAAIAGLMHDIPMLEVYAILVWAEARRERVEDVLKRRHSDPEKWANHYGNYKHSLLFTIRRGKAGIRKYYAGWRTFVQLSRSNIRYLLELVDRTLALHQERKGGLDQPVDFVVQTTAAQNVGKKNLSELEGLSVFGANLTKLALGLGRVFQILAERSEGRRPEVNQFHISDTQPVSSEFDKLMTAAVMHLALVRDSGTKLDEADVKAYDYSLHPIYAPFFVFSYRRKRKLTLTPEQILGLVHNSRDAIREILKNNSVDQDAPLPEQLQLFEAYYGSAA